jgi:hypothetical protein
MRASARACSIGERERAVGARVVVVVAIFVVVVVVVVALRSPCSHSSQRKKRTPNLCCAPCVRGCGGARQLYAQAADMLLALGFTGPSGDGKNAMTFPPQFFEEGARVVGGVRPAALFRCSILSPLSPPPLHAPPP